jgi:hypothetical protein
VSVTGGLSIGIPVAVPGVIDCIALVNAPTGTFGLMKAVMMTDTVNKSSYNMHNHLSPKGPTGPTLKPMI